MVRAFIGHGIGEQFHTDIQILHYYDSRASMIMRPGMTFTIEPMITLGTWQHRMWDDDWTAVTADGKRTAQFEHTILVTDDGVDVLTGGPGAVSPPRPGIARARVRSPSCSPWPPRRAVATVAAATPGVARPDAGRRWTDTARCWTSPRLPRSGVSSTCGRRGAHHAAASCRRSRRSAAARPDVRFIGIDIGEDAAKAQDFIDELGISFDQFINRRGELTDALGAAVCRDAGGRPRWHGGHRAPRSDDRQRLDHAIDDL